MAAAHRSSGYFLLRVDNDHGHRDANLPAIALCGTSSTTHNDRRLGFACFDRGLHAQVHRPFERSGEASGIDRRSCRLGPEPASVEKNSTMRQDSTDAPPKPMGRRGAVVADTLGETRE
jgi:hypothetical protein